MSMPLRADDPRRALRARFGPAHHLRRQDRHIMTLAPSRHPERPEPVSDRSGDPTWPDVANRDRGGPGSIARPAKVGFRVSRSWRRAAAEHLAPRRQPGRSAKSPSRIAPGRGFLHWRLSDDGPSARPQPRAWVGIRTSFAEADIGLFLITGHPPAIAERVDRYAIENHDARRRVRRCGRSPSSSLRDRARTAR